VSTAALLLPVPRCEHRRVIEVLRYLQVKKRADERTRTAVLLQLRVCGQGLLRVAGVCKSRINKRSLVPSIARYCSVLRPG
jgi:hypothetical protein